MNCRFVRRLVLCGLCAVLALVATACSRSPQYSSLPAGTQVLAFGDSVTYGTGAAKGEDYPSKLAEISGWEIQNRGLPGDTTEGAMARLATTLEETRPALVILEIGGNDFLRRVPENQTRDNIRSMLKTIRQAGIPVVLVSVPRFSLAGAAFGALPDAKLYAELAKDEAVPLIPDIFADILSDPALKSDQVHPNAAGYVKLAEGIAARLADTGLLARR